MPKFVCSLYSNEVWNLSPEQANKQTFNTDGEAKEWFKQYCESPKFSGYTFDGNYNKNYVSCDGRSIGYINQYSDNATH
ncbi:hypothetical protein [Fischerella thermalis]|uniref:Uncharacterized protein n=1 Tax=Fischerella thermalis CCMEE 5318 TaxID=2019666 RepID=A0A2N6LEJ7_9CYAN|nr:hypothetical protein [Fischerella thermalis]PMB21888.1 hypothetical protein CEN46_13570 [Fischerella thermalis CCMEE 5318]